MYCMVSGFALCRDVVLCEACNVAFLLNTMPRHVVWSVGMSCEHRSKTYFVRVFSPVLRL